MINEKEAIELAMLLSLRDAGKGMSKKRYLRMNELRDSMNHNSCLNPKCRGYQGKEYETHCPICEQPLFKSKRHENRN